MPNTTVKLARGFELKNPIITASGTCGYGMEMEEYLDIAKLGGVSVKGLHINPKIGNSPQRIVETPAGMLNAIGLQNVGADAFAKEKLPILRDKGVNVIANLWGNEPDEYVAVVERLNKEEGIAAYEMNISCPNISKAFLEFGTNPELTYELVSKVRAATDRHLMVKLSPNAGDIAAIGVAAEKAGADSLSAINTITGLEIDMKTKKPAIFRKTGGLSGPAIRPIGLRCVWQIFKKVKIPIIGIGGIASLDDVLKYLYVGARAVQVGTMNFVEPGIANRLATELEQYMIDNEIDNLEQLVGIAHD
jgi:dihydroorotate dehydrogenase (NAD+) catalytic subunit